MPTIDALWPTPAIVACAAVALDWLLGEPRRWHPLAAFGRLAQWLEARLNRTYRAPRRAKALGTLAVALAVAPMTALSVWLCRQDPSGLTSTALLYGCLGGRSLAEHARAVAARLQEGALTAARGAVALLVSRNTEALGPSEISEAAVESVLENASDALLASLFWFLLAGAPGAVAHRLVNTLDALWGYPNERFRHFGWAAARLDDGLNAIPARLTALSFALLGRPWAVLHAWRDQGRSWKSPNAGIVMASGAAHLGLRLGGPAVYEGRRLERSGLGSGVAPGPDAIPRALGLITKTVALWLGISLAVTLAWITAVV